MGSSENRSEKGSLCWCLKSPPQSGTGDLDQDEFYDVIAAIRGAAAKQAVHELVG